MPFAIALSGLNAASADLEVTANNVANVNTNGFKESRAQFAEVFAVGTQSVGSSASGSGVRLSSVAQQFTQGNIDFTDNALDLAIGGEGFFVLSDNGARTYTRAGAFGVDNQGYVTNAQGARLQSYPFAGNGLFNTGTPTDLQLTTGANPPSATTVSNFGLNLPANATTPTNPVFDPADPASFNHTTSVTIYDSLGAAHTATVYFIKDAAPNTWNTEVEIDGTAVAGSTQITFNNDGSLNTPASGNMTLAAYTPSTGAADIAMDLNFSTATQFGSNFGVNSLSQDGYTTGRLTGVSVDAEGVVFARFTNGQSTSLGKLALANFVNPQGLQQLGDTNWGQSFASGDALLGEAGTASFGNIQSGALEASNVDLTAQLVQMITAQRNFQANAQMISTADTVTQTVINIR
ncbi:flagellar hook protein FlgE [Woeseia oceani]|uniref:Flagellar hook protein FlgE n=1 Tax=Woeseia oceani TaxID=1548547 RepID=A0A193LES4_9GAMM|nr:flagellar hook protein FlgE [Woeseia oceani]ANO51030.1 flagellar biosynthesis protein FlgE [Woeseia oceani]